MRNAQERGNLEQVALIGRTVAVAKLDFASTPRGQDLAVAALTTQTIVGDGAQQFGLRTALDERTGRVIATLTDPITGERKGQYRSDALLSARGGVVLDLATNEGISAETMTEVREHLQAVERDHVVQRSGRALDRARRDQVALMPPNPGKGSAGYAQYVTLGESRDALAVAEATFGAHVGLGRPVPQAAKVDLARFSQRVRSADREWRSASSPGPSAEGFAAMSPAARELYVAETQSAPARTDLAAITHEYASDRNWSTFDRPTYSPELLTARPPAPWIRHTRPLMDADFARIHQVSQGCLVEVVGSGDERLVTLHGGARAAESIWAAGYTTVAPRPGDKDLVIHAGPNFDGWAKARG